MLLHLNVGSTSLSLYLQYLSLALCVIYVWDSVATLFSAGISNLLKWEIENAHIVLRWELKTLWKLYLYLNIFSILMIVNEYFKVPDSL